MKRSTYTMSDDAHEVLTTVGNRSGYLDHLVLRAEAECHQALAYLVDQGFGRPEIATLAVAASGARWADEVMPLLRVRIVGNRSIMKRFASDQARVVESVLALSREYPFNVGLREALGAG